MVVFGEELRDGVGGELGFGFYSGGFRASPFRLEFGEEGPSAEGN